MSFRSLLKMKIVIPLISHAIQGPWSRPNCLRHLRSSAKLREAEVEFWAAEKAKEEALLQQRLVEGRNDERGGDCCNAKMQAWQSRVFKSLIETRILLVSGNRACFSHVVVNSNNLNINVAIGQSVMLPLLRFLTNKLLKPWLRSAQVRPKRAQQWQIEVRLVAVAFKKMRLRYLKVLVFTSMVICHRICILLIFDFVT